MPKYATPALVIIGCCCTVVLLLTKVAALAGCQRFAGSNDAIGPMARALIGAGMVLAVACVYLNRRIVAALPYPTAHGAGGASPRQQRTLVIAGGQEETVRRCRAALQELPKRTAVASAIRPSRFALRHPRTWASIWDRYCVALDSVVRRHSRHCVRIEIDEPGWIVARTPWSWKSYGERVTIAMRSLEPDRTECLLRSVPIVPTTLLDYGRGIENVEELRMMIQSAARSSDAAAAPAAHHAGYTSP